MSETSKLKLLKSSLQIVPEYGGALHEEHEIKTIKEQDNYILFDFGVFIPLKSLFAIWGKYGLTEFQIRTALFRKSNLFAYKDEVLDIVLVEKTLAIEVLKEALVKSKMRKKRTVKPKNISQK